MKSNIMAIYPSVSRLMSLLITFSPSGSRNNTCCAVEPWWNSCLATASEKPADLELVSTRVALSDYESDSIHILLVCSTLHTH